MPFLDRRVVRDGGQEVFVGDAVDHRGVIGENERAAARVTREQFVEHAEFFFRVERDAACLAMRDHRRAAFRRTTALARTKLRQPCKLNQGRCAGPPETHVRRAMASCVTRARSSAVSVTRRRISSNGASAPPASSPG